MGGGENGGDGVLGGGGLDEGGGGDGDGEGGGGDGGDGGVNMCRCTAGKTSSRSRTS